jgi:uncharacterized paraquat-inducible protein A
VTVESRNALMSKFSEALFSLVADLWLSAPVCSIIMTRDNSNTLTKPSFLPSFSTHELLLIAVQHLAMTGLFERIQPPADQNTYLLSHQHKTYGFIRKQLYCYLAATFSSYAYQYDASILSQV